MMCLSFLRILCFQTVCINGYICVHLGHRIVSMSRTTVARPELPAYAHEPQPYTGPAIEDVMRWAHTLSYARPDHVLHEAHHDR